MERFKTILKLSLSACLALAGPVLMAQNALYVKFKEKSVLPVCKAGERVALSRLPVPAYSEMKGVSVREAVSLGGRLAGNRIYRLDCASEAERDALMKELRKDADVEYVEVVPLRQVHGFAPASRDVAVGKREVGNFSPVGSCSFSGTGVQGPEKGAPDDPYYANPDVEGLDLNWHLDKINASGAWEIAQGNPDIKLAVIDNAVWGGHEDLELLPENQYNVFTGENDSAPQGVDSAACSSDSYYDGTCFGYNWSHGTHVAGLAAAINNNGKGIASVAGGVTLMGVHCGVGEGIDVSHVADGIAWAVEHGADVVNLSVGGLAYSRTEAELIAEAVRQGVIFVASAGNDGENAISWPAAYPGVIPVASCDVDGNISDFSNRGYWVDVMAPGGYGPDARQDGIFSTMYSFCQDLRLAGYTSFENVRYDRMRGTSMACPLVASVCALMLSKDSTLGYQDIRSILMQTAQPSLTSGISENSGVVDAQAALAAVDSYVRPLPLEYLRSFSVEMVPGSTVPLLSWEGDESAEKPASLRLYRNNLLLAQGLPAEIGEFRDSTARSKSIHRYEICEVDAEGKESYRLSFLYEMPEQYRLILTSDPEGAGRLEGAGLYLSGSTVKIKAEAMPGYDFLYWNRDGAVFGERDSMEVVVNGDIRLVAKFSGGTASEARLPGSFRIYPNPVVSGEFQVRDASGLPLELERMDLFDLSGRLLGSWFQESASYTLPDCVPACYVLRITTEDGRVLDAKLVVGR